MSDHEQHEREAAELLLSRIAEMRAFLEMEDAGEGDDDHGSVYDYGLEWTKWRTDHIAETVTYKHVLSTGGPHDEFQVTFALDRVDSVTFVYLPWFDRVEIEVNNDGVVDFYEAFFAPE